jgi:hypothetical protein
MRCRSWPPNKASPGPAFVVALDACGETGTLCVGRNTLGLTQFDGSLLAGHCPTPRLRCGTRMRPGWVAWRQPSKQADPPLDA